MFNVRVRGQLFRMVLCGFVVHLLIARCEACPFCPPSSPPLAEQLAASDIAVLVKWVSTEVSPEDATVATTRLEIVEVFRSLEVAPKSMQRQGDILTLPYQLQARPGDLFVILGQRREELIDWQLPVEVTEISYAYIKQAPSPEKPAAERLPYFLKFLQFSDPLVANDAFSEFSRARYEDLLAIRSQLSRAKVRQWMAALTPTEQLRLGFYALLLGLCGDATDIEYLEKEVLKPTPGDMVRLGLDGMMGGYVLLTGEEGLNRLIAARLDAPDQPDGDVYAFVNTLRFLWQYAPDRAPRSRVAETMTRLLERPAFAEVAIVDLARWGHWSITSMVLAKYGHPPFDDPFAKRQVIQFALACIKAHPRDPQAAEDNPHAAAARQFLEALEQSDPDAVRNARRFFARGPDTLQ